MIDQKADSGQAGSYGKLLRGFFEFYQSNKKANLNTLLKRKQIQ
jgi:hypothetical protein